MSERFGSLLLYGGIVLGAFSSWLAIDADPNRKGLARVIVIVCAIAALAGAHIERRERDATAAADRARLEKSENFRIPRKVPRVPSFPLNLTVGGNTMLQIQAPGKYKMVATDDPNELHFEIHDDRSMTLEGILKDRSGAIAVEVRASELIARSPERYDINSDPNGVEIIEEDGDPVIQVDVVGQSVRLNYLRYLPLPDGQLRVEAATDKGTFLDSVPSHEVNRSLRHRLERHFQYPGHEHPGLRVDSTSASR